MMTPKMRKGLLAAMEALLETSDEERANQGYVYERLALDMAKAAELVYDACLKGQQYAELQR
jgi:hypothetical protein